MKPSTFKILAVAVLALSTLSPVVSAADKTKAVSHMTATPDLKWEPYAPGSPLSVAPLWGDRNAPGDHAMYLKLPAGFHAGFHSHTLAYHALNIQGTWVHTEDTGRVVELPPQSYVFQLGKADHDDACKGPEDCILFIFQKGKGDFIPAAKP